VAAVAFVVLVVVSIASAWTVATAERTLRDAHVTRFSDRAALHARFVHAYLLELTGEQGAASTDLTAEEAAGLARFLATASPAPGSTRVLLDGAGRIVDGGGPLPAEVRETIASGEAPGAGSVGEGEGERFVVRSQVPGTDWSLVLAIPSEQLFLGLTGWERVTPWVVWALLTMAGGVAVAAILLVERQRGALAEREYALALTNRGLEHANVELARSNAELEQFAYLASHDLQEPLRKVASYVQLLQRRYQGRLDDDADEFIGYAVDGAIRMQRLIADLLTYSRAGRRTLDVHVVDLTAVVDAALADLQLRVEETGASIEVARPLPTVAGDPGMLRQVLQNLLDNALKFHGDSPPVVHVTGGWRGAERVHLVVADEGIGIPAEQIDRVLGLFQRLHSRTEYPGTGLGLAICQRIVERHGGTIEFRPHHPTGVEVHLELPAAPEVST
jgi:signal transduction histidine kinase